MAKQDWKQVFDDQHKTMLAARHERFEKIKVKLGFDVLLTHLVEIFTELGGVLVGQPKFTVRERTGMHASGQDYYFDITLAKESCSREMVIVLTTALPSLRFVKHISQVHKKEESLCVFYMLMSQRAPAWAFNEGEKPDVKLTVKRLKLRTVKKLSLTAKRYKEEAGKQLMMADSYLEMSEDILKM